MSFSRLKSDYSNNKKGVINSTIESKDWFPIKFIKKLKKNDFFIFNYFPLKSTLYPNLPTYKRKTFDNK